MKNKAFLISVITLWFTVSTTKAQSVEGFWHVTKVVVGDQTMTPVAKWFKFSADGRATGGNGWTQNSSGSYTFNEKTNELSPTNDMGIKDNSGPFKVSFSADTMRWNRIEEGMKVVVTLIPAQSWSPAPIDLVKGLWSLIKVEDGEGNEVKEYDAEKKQYLFIRPDMRFRLRNPDGSLSNGFWHMHGHRPILTLINYDRAIENKEYIVTFGEGSLTMQSRGEDANVYYYTRISEFPN